MLLKLIPQRKLNIFRLFCEGNRRKVASSSRLLSSELKFDDRLTFLFHHSTENHVKIRTNLVRSLPKPNSV